MTDKITVELDIEDARELARGTWLSVLMQHVQSAIKAALPPEWEEGTLAWVTYRNGPGNPALCVWKSDGWYRGGNLLLPRGAHEYSVEPIRVLKDDEVAVKDPRSIGYPPSALRYAAKDERKAGNPTLASWLEDLADALEAEK